MMDCKWFKLLKSNFKYSGRSERGGLIAANLPLISSCTRFNRSDNFLI